MADTGGTLKKTTHKTLGHAPASVADYTTAFSPNLATGGWHRGDGCFSIHGDGWSLFSFNDFFVSASDGTPNPIFRRNSVLMVDTATGVVSWLSSGDQFPLAGSVTFPGPGDGTYAWLKGGWVTGAASAILFAGRYSTVPALLDMRVMGIAGITGASPTCTAVVTTDLTATFQWSGQPLVDGGYVYLYGVRGSTLTHHLARHAYSTDPADYATGWTYWTGSTWSSSVANSVGLTVSSAGLGALNVRRWVWGFLGTAKFFDTAPELAIPDVWPDIHAWWSPTPQGPWWWVGHIYNPTTLDTWYSYLGRLEYLAGLSGPVALWSINKAGKTAAEIAMYGPQFGTAIPPAGGQGSISSATSRAGSGSGQGALAGSGSGSRAAVGDNTGAVARAGTATHGQSGVGSATAGHSG